MALAPATVLAEVWRSWVARLTDLDATAWATPTRCEGWTVHDLAAHAAPDPTALARPAGGGLSTRAAVDDAAELLRRFNAPGGVAHVYATQVAQQARSTAGRRPPPEVIDRFAAAARMADDSPLDPSAVLPYPAVGSVTAAVVVEISLLEATVHMLDLIAAVGGPPPPQPAVDLVAGLLLRVAGPCRFVEVASGRAACDELFPAIR